MNRVIYNRPGNGWIDRRAVFLREMPMDPDKGRIRRRPTSTSYFLLAGSLIGSLIGALIVEGRGLLRFLVSPVRRIATRLGMRAEPANGNHTRK